MAKQSLTIPKKRTKCSRAKQRQSPATKHHQSRKKTKTHEVQPSKAKAIPNHQTPPKQKNPKTDLIFVALSEVKG